MAGTARSSRNAMEKIFMYTGLQVEGRPDLPSADGW
jgi:hypothetical protein